MASDRNQTFALTDFQAVSCWAGSGGGWGGSGGVGQDLDFTYSPPPPLATYSQAFSKIPILILPKGLVSISVLSLCASSSPSLSVLHSIFSFHLHPTQLPSPPLFFFFFFGGGRLNPVCMHAHYA